MASCLIRALTWPAEKMASSHGRWGELRVFTSIRHACKAPRTISAAASLDAHSASLTAAVSLQGFLHFAQRRESGRRSLIFRASVTGQRAAGRAQESSVRSRGSSARSRQPHDWMWIARSAFLFDQCGTAPTWRRGELRRRCRGDSPSACRAYDDVIEVALRFLDQGASFEEIAADERVSRTRRCPQLIATELIL